jgi:hypothetical protein
MPGVLRVRITDREVEQVSDPTKVPLLHKDTRTQGIYALDWEEP